MSGHERLELVAIPTHDQASAVLEPASRTRRWMERTSAGVCLPLLVANESGWWFRNPTEVTVEWNGGPRVDDSTVTYTGPPTGERLVLSHFGHGIITFRIPYLFRTSAGWNLLVRGPANAVKDGIAALEGLVETDWSPFTFTMNWKLTRPDHPVTFAAGEPVCMIVPQLRGALQCFDARIGDRDSETELMDTYDAWRQNRHELHVKKFLAEHVAGMETVASAWEKNYFRGQHPDGTKAPEHETRIRLGRFEGA